MVKHMGKKKFSKEDGLNYAKKKDYLSGKIYLDYIYIYTLLIGFLGSSIWLAKLILDLDDFRSSTLLIFLALMLFCGLSAILRLFSIVVKLKK